MIRFLFKGLIRDRSRSQLPILVVAIGVMLSVFLHAYVAGLMGDMVEQTAKFTGGHVKVMSAAYAENMGQNPNDLALMGVDEISKKLKENFPDIQWATRINFGGLIDAPDANGDTKSQGPAMGMGIDILSGTSGDVERLNLQGSLVKGNIPSKQGEVLLSDNFAQKLDVYPGDAVTLIGSTMNGGMAFYNFTVSGTLKFGNTAMDRGTIIADISDVQLALNMEDAAGEILGFVSQGYFNDEFVDPVIAKIEKIFPANEDEYRPVIKSLRHTKSMNMYIDLAKSMGAIITAIFMIAMSLVLWNAGLLGGLRRYGEIGIRLAIGEEKVHVYKTMIYESVIIGIVGTILGTAVGLFLAWLLQKYGLNIGEFTKNASSSVMIPNVIHARITIVDYYIGFIPGVISTLIGTMLAGIGIFKRKTAQLFKELEA